MMPSIEKLHHFAYRCRNAEQTRAFYEDVLGLKLAHVIEADTVPSTGEYSPYFHIFFELGDGSYVAFFDLGDDQATVPDPETPSWVNHLALEVADEAALEAAKVRLEGAGVEVLGPTDHGFVKSIYFFDPNDIRLELTCRLIGDDAMAKKAAEAHAGLEAWMARRGRAAAE
jgi:catechol 2,3-dioxygenase-like lactoylglutathione lyase family enzyme